MFICTFIHLCMHKLICLCRNICYELFSIYTSNRVWASIAYNCWIGFFYFIEMKANLQYTSLLNFQHENDVNILLHETEYFYPFLYCKYLIYYSENGNRTHYYIIVLIILQSVILQMLWTNPSPYTVINLSMHPFKLMSSILRENV